MLGKYAIPVNTAVQFGKKYGIGGLKNVKRGEGKKKR